MAAIKEKGLKEYREFNKHTKPKQREGLFTTTKQQRRWGVYRLRYQLCN